MAFCDLSILPEIIFRKSNVWYDPEVTYISQSVQLRTWACSVGQLLRTMSILAVRVTRDQCRAATGAEC